MNENPQLPYRRSPRLRGYDYAQEGAYFITLCTQHRLHLFGEIVDDAMQLNPAGVMVAHWWEKLPAKFAAIELDVSVVMPNHFHGIVVINRAASGGRTELPRSISPLEASLNDVVGWFKTMTPNAYFRGVKYAAWPSVPGKLWQRSYHDHIIRNEESLNRLREYVIDNPVRWQEDTFYVGKE